MAQNTETQIPSSPAHSISTASDSASEKVYKCDFPDCNKTYARLYSLKRHMVSHSGVKKFACKTCGKRFALKQCLKEHSFIHTGEKPYVCPFPGCNKRFRQTGKLSIHKKSHGNFNLIKEVSMLNKFGAAALGLATNDFGALSHDHKHHHQHDDCGEEMGLIHRYVESQEFATLSAKIFPLPVPANFYDFCAITDKAAAVKCRDNVACLGHTTTMPMTTSENRMASNEFTTCAASSALFYQKTHYPSRDFNNQLKSWQL